MRKTHIKDIRLANNAGIAFPVCQANVDLLDMDKTGWIMAPADQATCQHCRRLYVKRYPWTELKP